MRVIALLSFFDEEVGMLTELVESLAAARVDSIVAVDGAYAEYPDAVASTGTEQAATILDVAYANGMEATVHVPQGPWQGNECEKRTFLFALGHQFAEAGEDWFWVVDADEVVESADGLHEALATTEHDVAEVDLYEPRGQRWDLRMLFRAQPTGIRVGPYHARYETGAGYVLWASCHRNYEEPAVLVPGCRVRHRPWDRPTDRNFKRRQYYERAVLLGLDEAVI
jgi:hypothetical protein